MKKTALITGASAGIGEATARMLAREGYNLILTARRQERLEALRKELGAAYGIEVGIHAFDICDREAVAQFVSTLEELPIDVLINNAGLAAGLSPLHEGNIDDWEQMIDMVF